VQRTLAVEGEKAISFSFSRFTAKQRLPSEHLECVVLPAHDGREGDAESSISIGRVDGLGG